MFTNIEIYRGNDNIYITCCPEMNLYANGRTQKEAILSLKIKIAKHMKMPDSIMDEKEEIKGTIHYYSARSPQIH